MQGAEWSSLGCLTEVSVMFQSTPCLANYGAAWSCPSAIGTAGVGVGGQAGAEMTDFLVVLNSRSVSILRKLLPSLPLLTWFT